MGRGSAGLAGIWLGLIVLTLGSTMIAEAAHHAALAVGVIFAIAALKAELVLVNFMEARRAEPHWIWLYRGWIGGVATMLAIGSWL